MTPRAARRNDDALQETIRQLWGPALERGDCRVTSTDDIGHGWRRARTFTVVGPPGRPSLLVERGDARAVARSLTAYGELRTARPRAGRYGLAAVARAGAPLGGRLLHLQVRDQAEPETAEPLTLVESVLGHPVLVHLGIRTGANAKATAQLFSTDGTPAGYAKFAWNSLTTHFVQTELRRLTHLAGRAGRLSAPRVIGSGSVQGMPFLVTQPLPGGVRQLKSPLDLTLEDLCRLTPISRVDVPGTSQHLTRLTHRLQGSRGDPVLAHVAEPLAELAGRLARCRIRLPIAEYDHGDLVPWNASADPMGKKWLWDWELSEDDAIAGTDVVHWYVHAWHGPAPDALARAVADAGRRAAPVHRALGISAAGSLLVTAAYALLIGERASFLAGAHRSWRRNRVTEDMVLELGQLGHEMMCRAEAVASSPRRPTVT